MDLRLVQNLVSIFLFILLFSENSATTIVTINTPQGLVKGKTEQVPGYGEVTKFLGLPYAQPPIGPFRFQPPQEPSSFALHDATFSRPICPQAERFLPFLNLTTDADIRWSMDEDCLYLNIYVPETVPPGHNSGRDLPVMVWIHGGGWYWGSGSHYDGRRLAAMGEVIVVTFNYRLGLLGFFPNGKQESTLGLADQIQALKWVRRNIHSYGGSSQQVTIFGESAGGASVSFLSVSPPARGLFKKAISQSGSYKSAWAFPRRNEEKLKALTLKKAAGCSLDLLECFRDTPASELVEITVSVLTSLQIVAAWTPDIDNYIIMKDYDHNVDLIHPGLKFIIGYNTDEGGFVVEYVCMIDRGSGCRLNHDDVISFENIKKWIAPVHNLKTIKTISKQYTDWYNPDTTKTSGEMTPPTAVRFATDWFERFAINQTAAHLSNAGHDVRVYEYNIKARKGFENILLPIPWSENAQHTDEVPFVFGLPDHVDDEVVTHEMVRTWTTFAKGKPMENWPQYGKKAEYIYIGRTSSKNSEMFEVRKPLISVRKEKFWHAWFYGGEFPPKPHSHMEL